MKNIIDIFESDETDEDEEFLGNAGQSEFSKWCSLAGLIVNPSSENDRTSWDYLVEFKHDFKLTGRTLQRTNKELKVQVKATRGNKRSRTIKLSNMRFACATDTPHFIIFIEYLEADEAQNVFLVHIDKDIIESSLEKIHKAKTEGKKTKQIPCNHKLQRKPQNTKTIFRKPKGKIQ